MFTIDLNAYDRRELEMLEHEKFLNSLGYLPLISILSGTFRLIEGFIMTLQSTIDFCEAYAHAVTAESIDEYAYYAFTANKEWDYSMHSVANSIRGIAEIIPVVNIFCIVYDSLGNRRSYTVETGGNETLIDSYSNFKGKTFLLHPLVYDYLMYRIRKVKEGREAENTTLKEVKAAS